MKRYLLFAGDYYYPLGGWDDFRDSFDTSEEAISAGRESKTEYTWWNVADATTGQKWESGDPQEGDT